VASIQSGDVSILCTIDWTFNTTNVRITESLFTWAGRVTSLLAIGTNSSLWITQIIGTWILVVTLGDLSASLNRITVVGGTSVRYSTVGLVVSADSLSIFNETLSGETFGSCSVTDDRGEDAPCNSVDIGTKVQRTWISRRWADDWSRDAFGFWNTIDINSIWLTDLVGTRIVVVTTEFVFLADSWLSVVLRFANDSDTSIVFVGRTARIIFTSLGVGGIIEDTDSTSTTTSRIIRWAIQTSGSFANTSNRVTDVSCTSGVGDIRTWLCSKFALSGGWITLCS